MVSPSKHVSWAQVVLAVDDSRSMQENGCGAFALEAVTLLTLCADAPGRRPGGRAALWRHGSRAPAAQPGAPFYGRCRARHPSQSEIRPGKLNVMMGLPSLPLPVSGGLFPEVSQSYLQGQHLKQTQQGRQLCKVEINIMCERKMLVLRESGLSAGQHAGGPADGGAADDADAHAGHGPAQRLRARQWRPGAESAGAHPGGRAASMRRSPCAMSSRYIFILLFP